MNMILLTTAAIQKLMILMSLEGTQLEGFQKTVGQSFVYKDALNRCLQRVVSKLLINFFLCKQVSVGFFGCSQNMGHA
jgi:hypothetical protein